MSTAGVKTANSDKKVTQDFSLKQLKIGMDALKQVIDDKNSIKHFKFN